MVDWDAQKDVDVDVYVDELDVEVLLLYAILSNSPKVNIAIDSGASTSK